MIEKIDTYDNANIRRLQHNIDVLVSLDDVLDFKTLAKAPALISLNLARKYQTNGLMIL